MHLCAYTSSVEFEWDPRKASSNFQKHGIRFASAIDALADEYAITIRDDNPDEERWITIGLDAEARAVVVVYTWRAERIRLISARLATPSEIRQYKEQE